MALSDIVVRNSKPTDRPRKLFDSGGLFLLVMPQGGKLWRLKYRIGGLEKLLSLGRYPDVSLKRAREKRDEARQQIADNIDPTQKRKAEKLAQAETFEAVGREWLQLQGKKMAPATFEKCRWILEDLIFKHIPKDKAIGKLLATDFLKVLRRIESRGKHETAHRARQRCSQILRFAVATGRVERDVTSDLRGALAPIVTTNRPAITDPTRIGELLRSIDGYQGQPATHYALKLAPLAFVRPGELRGAEWTEFDLDRAEWRIPPERTKMGDLHVVPLSTQVVKLLLELQPWTGQGKYLFPSLRSGKRPMSNNTINAALRRLGYASDEMCGHGFRATASTCLNELGWAPDIIERQLAHAERNKVRAAYNRAEHLGERRKMMQAWADYLDGLRTSANVVPNKTSG